MGLTLDSTCTLAERYLTQPAIDRRLPEHSREPRMALALLESEMLLDGDPAKNLATFVTTFMEPEAVEVIAANLHRNFIDHAEYPRTAELANRCVRMLHGLFHGTGEPDAPGTACAGSSEAVMLGALAMKWRWKAARESRGQADRPAEPGLRRRRARRLGQVLPLLRRRAAPGPLAARALHRRPRRSGAADRREHDRRGRRRRHDLHRRLRRRRRDRRDAA